MKIKKEKLIIIPKPDESDSQTMAMLNLSPGKNDGVIVGDDIEITVLAISGNTVKLGISAPAYKPLHRKEI